MYEYKLSTNAKEDLKRIYAYGLAEFGEQRADKYFYDFYSMFDKITISPYIYQSIDHIRPGYRRCTCGSDSIYYRINSTTIEIMAILGSVDLWS
ncbi:MAG: type II toxin-antitoxin system RelE/ParE family toxin [Psychrosphaera sp.]|nr:type II toxin-antitoxin system RelE/ParE family toxin [Psychrosphaera sp.]